MIRRPDGRIYQYVKLRESAHGGREIIISPEHQYRGFSLFEQQPDRFVAMEFDYAGGRWRRSRWSSKAAA